MYIEVTNYLCGEKNALIKYELMKYGMRKPSWKKSLSARTTGRAKRAVKRAIIPGYGKRGMGWLHPKKALYNRVYRRTTFSIFDLLKAGSGRGTSNSGCCVILMFVVALVCTIVYMA